MKSEEDDTSLQTEMSNAWISTVQQLHTRAQQSEGQRFPITGNPTCQNPTTCRTGPSHGAEWGEVRVRVHAREEGTSLTLGGHQGRSHRVSRSRRARVEVVGEHASLRGHGVHVGAWGEHKTSLLNHLGSHAMPYTPQTTTVLATTATVLG